MDAGLPASVLDTRILPRRLATRLDMFIDEVDARLRKLFAFGIREVLSHREFAPTALQFKLPASANQVRTRAYAAYLDGLCSIVAKAVRRKPSLLPGTIEDMHAQLFFYGLSLQSAVEACWEMGIGVIALDDRIAFNGACWRRNGRAVIVLRNTGDEESRALFDLIHELYHLIATEGDFALIEAEETSSERRESREEQRANRFAAEVLTEGRLAAIISEFLQRSNGQVSRLSEAAIEIANEENIPVGILANLFAAHVDRENSNRSWWAAARNLQEPGDPWRTVRDIFIRNAELDRLDRVETDLINQMLETSDERTDGQT
jgi:Zn-dependent peptidase ImmA (M78 family)